MRDFKWVIEDCSLDERALLKNESVFASVNGHIGVRGNFEEGCGGHKTIRGSYISGCWDTGGIEYDEKLYGFPEEKQTVVNAHDCQTVYIKAGDETMSLFRGRVLSFKRTLDMKTGVSRRQIEWESESGRCLRIDITRMASFAVKELFTIDCRVTPLNFSGEICFVSGANADVVNYTDSEDPRTSSSGEKSLKFVRGCIRDGIGYLESETAHSGIRVGTAFCNTLSAEGAWAFHEEGASLTAEVKTNVRQGAEARFVKYVFFMDPSNGDMEEAAFFLARQFSGGIDALYKKQREYLDARWRTADVAVDSKDDADESLRYCLYQLICHSVFSGGSIPAKGLTGEGYSGHCFWDTEIFVLPFFSLTDPEAAKKLLLFRYRGLPAARANARLLGHAKGAAYPWRTISGSECSTFFPGGAAQYHINADIAYAVTNYYFITGDETLLLNEGAEIIFETARLWTELGHFHDGKFRIDTVTGPDEYTCMIDNNYYTNLMARHNLRWAAFLYKKLAEAGGRGVIERIGLLPEEAAEFKKAYENMYLPQDEVMGITPQDDSFLAKKKWDFAGTPRDKYPLLLHYHPMTLYRYQVCKQADVLLAYYLFQRDHDKALMERSYDFYEGITTHDSSLSECIFSIMAARLGRTEKGYQYFNRTIRLDMDDIHGNTKDGLHMANLGGSYLCILGGFAGLMIDSGGASLAPVLPENWRSYRFRFLYRGSLFEVCVREKGTELRRISGEPREIRLNGESITC